MEQVDSAQAVEAIRRRLSLREGVSRFPTGSLPVFAVGDDCVVKLFPADEQDHFATEVAALTRVEGSLSIPTPRIVSAGEHEGWHYVVMNRLRGHSLADAWDTIDLDARVGLMREIGTALAELHALSTESLTPLAVDWPAFISAQRASCTERQRACGLASPWIDQIDGFLTRWTPNDVGPRVLLHTEIMRGHLLVERHDGRWRLTGLMDFEPAMVGAWEYELAAVGVYLTCAEPRLLRGVLDGYGTESEDSLPCRIMSWVLLHRYSNLKRYLGRLPAANSEGDIESLARRWFTP